MNNKHSGFILIKTVIAISILAMALTLSVRLIGVSSNTIRENRLRTQSLYLAQQCLEWTRNVRDTAWKQNLPWDCAFPLRFDASTEYGQVINRNGLVDTGRCTNAKLGYEIKGYNDADAEIPNTVFSRKLIVSEKSPGELELECQVSWDVDGNVSLSHILTNWKR